VPQSKIHVIYHGISPTFTTATPTEVANLRNALNLPVHYVLFVGTVQPRKNIARIAAAMVRLEAVGLPHKLAIAGKTGWLVDEVERELASIGRPDLTIRLGYVPDADLPALYSAADAFCFPSLYEGFGLPVLEAMACGTPVVTSNLSSLPEISGEAALLVDPASVDEISAALIRVLTDQEERARLTAAGLKRSREFTWSRTADETLSLLESVRDQPK
jgi:glycosyltransferase involved in cell wall biosynthesis